jgi:hypothetical protein
MAKLLFGPTILDARGKFAGTVYSRNLYGPFIRKHTSPGSNVSAIQRRVRSNVATSAKRWPKILLEAQRAGWITLAGEFPKTDRFGKTQPLSGPAMYCRVNSTFITCNTPRTDAPPLTQTPFDIGGLSAAYRATPGPEILITIANPIPPGQCLVIAASPPLSPGCDLGNTYRVVNLIAVPPNSTQELWLWQVPAVFSAVPVLVPTSSAYPIAQAYLNKYTMGANFPYGKGIAFAAHAVNTTNGASGKWYRAGLVLPRA